ncbi:hypothetical protein [Photobacterium leiognathi]|uniref:hypothetical protein n=1 Tax=Photobacterium leiognathi TaxID=553611 RepID=UPI00298210F8|nr:hypothetical protein [Photobacterium leiognathi]
MSVTFASFGTAPEYKALGFKGTVELTGTKEEIEPLFICEKRDVVCVEGADFNVDGTYKPIWYVMVKENEY